MMKNGKRMEKNMDTGTQNTTEKEQLALDDARRVKVLSPGMLVFKRFMRNRLAIVIVF